MGQRTDEQLVALVVEKDDRHAFAELIERYKRAVFALLSRTLGYNADLEDVAQNVFLAVYRGLPAFKQEARFSTWLYRVVYNQACSEIRRKKAKKETLLTQHKEDESGQVVEYGDPHAVNPEDVVLKQQVWNLVEQLPVQSAAVIEMHYGQNMSYPEIADVLEIPLGTVKTYLHRARARLRELLVSAESAKEKTG